MQGLIEVHCLGHEWRIRTWCLHTKQVFYSTCLSYMKYDKLPNRELVFILLWKQPWWINTWILLDPWMFAALSDNEMFEEFFKFWKRCGGAPGIGPASPTHTIHAWLDLKLENLEAKSSPQANCCPPADCNIYWNGVSIDIQLTFWNGLFSRYHDRFTSCPKIAERFFLVFGLFLEAVKKKNGTKPCKKWIFHNSSPVIIVECSKHWAFPRKRLQSLIIYGVGASCNWFPNSQDPS